jgi:hypothetical protein
VPFIAVSLTSMPAVQAPRRSTKQDDGGVVPSNGIKGQMLGFTDPSLPAENPCTIHKVNPAFYS